MKSALAYYFQTVLSDVSLYTRILSVAARLCNVIRPAKGFSFCNRPQKFSTAYMIPGYYACLVNHHEAPHIGSYNHS